MIGGIGHPYNAILVEGHPRRVGQFPVGGAAGAKRPAKRTRRVKDTHAMVHIVGNKQFTVGLSKRQAYRPAGYHIIEVTRKKIRNTTKK